MKKIITKIITLILCICLSFSFLNIFSFETVYAESSESEYETAKSWWIDLFGTLGYLVVNDLPIPFLGNAISLFAKHLVLNVASDSFISFCDMWDTGFYQDHPEDFIIDTYNVCSSNASLLEEIMKQGSYSMSIALGYFLVPCVKSNKIKSSMYYQNDSVFTAKASSAIENALQNHKLLYVYNNFNTLQILALDNVNPVIPDDQQEPFDITINYYDLISSDTETFYNNPSCYYEAIINYTEGPITDYFYTSRKSFERTTESATCVTEFGSNLNDLSWLWAGCQTENRYGWFVSDYYDQMPIFISPTGYVNYFSSYIKPSPYIPPVDPDGPSGSFTEEEIKQLFDYLNKIYQKECSIYDVQKAFDDEVILLLEAQNIDTKEIKNLVSTGLFDGSNRPYLYTIYEILQNNLINYSGDLDSIKAKLVNILDTLQHINDKTINYSNDLDRIIFLLDKLNTSNGAISDYTDQLNNVISLLTQLKNKDVDFSNIESKLDTIISLLQQSSTSSGSSSSYDDNELQIKLDMIIALLTLDVGFDFLEFLPPLDSDINFTDDFLTNLNLLTNLAKSRFPFCVPSDVVLISNFIGASPVEPNLTIPINFGGYETSFTIDLSFYDDYARSYVKGFLILSLIIFLSILSVKIFDSLRG